MEWLQHLVLLVISWLPITCSIEKGNCFHLFNKCNARYNCFASLINLEFLCHSLLNGEGGLGCTENCREAIKMLGTDKHGKEFLTCDCDRDSECLTYQARASKCLHNRTMESKVGCATYSRQCKTDVGCDNIMERFYLKCTHLISGTECTQACEMVQEELYSNNITKGLLDCECSGTVREENFCRGITAHTLHLCKTSPMVREVQDGKDRGTKNMKNQPKNGGSKLTSVANANLGSSGLRNGQRNFMVFLVLLKVFLEMLNRLTPI